jgi:anti-anti-sigma factor
MGGALGHDEGRNETMGIAIEDLGDGRSKAVLDGSLDIAGAAAIDMRMNLLGGSAKGLLIDMNQVTFIGSMGLRSLVAPARAILARGGKVVIVNPSEMVEKVLRTSGIDTIIPIHPDESSALAAL